MEIDDVKTEEGKTEKEQNNLNKCYYFNIILKNSLVNYYNQLIYNIFFIMFRILLFIFPKH